MGRIGAVLHFRINDELHATQGIEDFSDLRDYEFLPWDELPSQKFLNVGDSFTFEDEVYRINEIRTNLNIYPIDLQKDDPDYGSKSSLYIIYYVQKIE